MAVHAGDDCAHFEEALVSLRRQTYRNLRIMIYCDGPLQADKENLLATYLDTAQGRDVIVKGATCSGLPTGLNCLIGLAVNDPTIEFMARMDADDISTPERIAEQVKFLEDHPDIALVGTWCIEFVEAGVPLFLKRLPCNNEELANFMIYRNPLAHPTVVFRRSIFEAGYRYREDFTLMQDYDLWARLHLAGYKISNVPKFLLWYRTSEKFFTRRAGLRRAVTEVHMRLQYARRSGLLRLKHIPGILALLILRNAPESIKKLAYRHRH